MTNLDDSTCPMCGSLIPENAPQGLCPKCVMEGAANVADPAPTAGGKTPPPSIKDVASHFPELEILEIIGAGGMGVIYKARQPKLDRLVALKILWHDFGQDPAFEERFNREARVLARLNHPHIVTVFDFGTAGPFCYLLMEFVDGVNLRQAMRAGGFSPADTLALVQDVCSALKFAHEEGILHRDIKPENVLIDSRGRVKIADFGIAKLIGQDEKDDVTLTMQGSVLGSLQYMAPEQIETPGDVDQRADIYSLGVVFYELLTGELPLGRFAPPSEKSSIDSRIDEIVMRTLEKERDARFQSADEMRTKVESVTRSGPYLPERRRGESGENATAPKEPGIARFATASAILTGISLLTAVVAAIVLDGASEWIERAERGDGPGLVPIFFPVVAVACLLMVGVPAFLGILFGGKALGEIRQSGGRKSGCGSAMFGALAWPVLVLLAVTGMLNVIFVQVLGKGISGPFFLALAAAFAGPVAIYLMVSSVGRWARGESQSARNPSGWKGFLRVAFVILITLLGFQLVLAWLLPAPDFGSRKSLSQDDPARVRGEQNFWLNGRPEIVMDFVAPKGHVSFFALQSPWDVDHESPDDWYVVGSDDEDFRGSLEIGIIGFPKLGGKVHTEIGAILQDLEGKTKKIHRIVVAGKQNVSSPELYPLFEIQDLPDGDIYGSEELEFTGSIDLSKRGLHFIVFGIHTDNELFDSARLLAWSMPRPESSPGRPVILDEGRIGPASPPSVIDNWSRHAQKQAQKAKGKAPEGEKILSVDEVEGDVRVRSGFLFDTKERPINGKTGVFLGENLLLSGNSRATFLRGHNASVRLETQDESTSLLFHSYFDWILLPNSGLRAQFEGKVEGTELQIQTPFGSMLKIGESVAFQLTSQGCLEVWEGEIEVAESDGKKSNFVKAGQEVILPIPVVPEKEKADGPSVEQKKVNGESEPQPDCP